MLRVACALEYRTWFSLNDQHESNAPNGGVNAPATHQQDFFAVLAARCQQASAGAGSDVDEELSKYLSDKSIDVTALNCYQLIRKLYIELNTGSPASAAVETCETVFSGGGRVFSPL